MELDWASVFASLLATVIGITAAWAYRTVLLRRKYLPMSGHYSEYSFNKPDGNKPDGEASGFAEIKYIGGNKLSIRVEEMASDRSWEGLIEMQNQGYGSITWHYVELPDSRHEFGHRDCIVPESGVVYLVGEENRGFHKVVLKRSTT